MNTVSFGPIKPAPISYMPRPDSELNEVRLRKNIREVEYDDVEYDEETGKEIPVKRKEWRANEVFALTTVSLAEIEADFDNYFYLFGPQPSLEERIEILEGVVGEIMEG